MKNFILSLLIFCLMVVTANASQLKDTTELDWPKKNIKIIVPYAGGGSTDLMARLMATEFSKKFPVSAFVENKTGGGGSVGMLEAAKSKPDGYTIIMTSIGACTIIPNSRNVGYTDEDFSPISQMTEIYNVIGVHADSGIKTFNELISKAKENFGKMTYASPGIGLTQNVQMESLLLGMDAAGLFTHVPYSGGTEVITALLGKQVDVALAVRPEMISSINDGNIIALAIIAPQRDPSLPNVPTLKELGINLSGGVWYGMAAPAGTPKAIVKLLDESIHGFLQQQDIIDKFSNLKQPIVYLNHEDFAEKWTSDYKTYQEFFKKK
jgi:tripartite-type tricarboxylate transporter receptor subunit TctC